MHEIVKMIATSNITVKETESNPKLNAVLILEVSLKRSTKCEKKIYQKILGTVLDLYVPLKKEDLRKFQKASTTSPNRASHQNLSKVNDNLEPTDMPNREIRVPTSWVCKYCGHMTRNNWFLRKHIRLHHTPGIKIFTCDLCSFKATYKRTFDYHQRNCHRNITDLYQCPLCPFISGRKCIGRKLHRLEHLSAENKTFNCPDCSFKARKASQLKLHLSRFKNCDVSEIYKCDECSYHSNKKASVKRHKMLTHMTAGQISFHQCKVCNFLAETEDSLEAHFNTFHGDLEVQSEMTDGVSEETQRSLSTTPTVSVPQELPD